MALVESIVEAGRSSPLSMMQVLELTEAALGLTDAAVIDRIALITARHLVLKGIATELAAPNALPSRNDSWLKLSESYLKGQPSDVGDARDPVVESETGSRSYDGVAYILKDQTWIGKRKESKYGGSTIDINYPDDTRNKVRVAPKSN